LSRTVASLLRVLSGGRNTVSLAVLPCRSRVSVMITGYKLRMALNEGDSPVASKLLEVDPAVPQPEDDPDVLGGGEDPNPIPFRQDDTV
jgi:hypothetical protein